jgi:pyruvate dehydrogenase E1 component alpha subunit
MTVKKPAQNLKSPLKDHYLRMLRIRRVEEAIAAAYPEGKMRCPVHLSIGQEAPAVGICAHLDPSDRVYSTHRCHAHYLAKGGNLSRMLAELHGRATGCARGKGGSMHLVDVEQGMMGSSALVAGSIPLAVGSALAFRMADEPRVAVAFLGDGASEEGIFYESMAFAALRRLPVIFACENNFYATYSHQSARQPTPYIAQRGSAFGIPGREVDGNDVEAVSLAAEEAIFRARRGNGPTLLELRTYRWKDHVGPGNDTHLGFRSEDEVEAGIGRCPLARAERRLQRQGWLSDEEREVAEAGIRREIAEAFAFALESEFPDAQEIYRDVYANEIQ